MKRKPVFCFLVLFLTILSSLSVFAATSQQVTLEEGQSVKVAGKTVLLETAYYDFIVVKVDGNKKTIDTFEAEDESGFIVYKSNTVYVGGVNITINDITGRNKVILTVDVAFNCGNDICESGESNSICCEDCNCSRGYTCVDNQCIESELNECFTDEECDDSNDCSFDSCKGLPRKCSYDVIDYCNDYDTCCPEICMYENDTDCPREKTMYECFSWRDCKKEGQSPCNSSACESGVCVYELQQGCSFNNTCMEINSTAVINGTESTCKQDGWLSQSGKTIGKEGTKEKGLKKYIWLFIVATVLLVTIVIISIYYKLSSKS